MVRHFHSAEINRDISSHSIRSIGGFDSHRYGTALQKFFYRSVSSFNKSRELPGLFRLDQNYPNPFNPTTTIGYNLPQAAHVTLCVDNELGQEVARLFDGNKLAGMYSEKFDGTGLASGVYFYRLETGSFVAVRKLMLVN